MYKRYNEEIIDDLAEMSDAEIEDLLGAGCGIVCTLTLRLQHGHSGTLVGLLLSNGHPWGLGPHCVPGPQGLN